MIRSPKVPNSEQKSLRVAAVQMIFADSSAGNLEKIEHAATKAAAARADAVLFPECATTGYACDFGALKPVALRQTLRSVAAVAARLRVNLLVGSPIFAGRKLYNALVVFDRPEFGDDVGCFGHEVPLDVSHKVGESRGG